MAIISKQQFTSSAIWKMLESIATKGVSTIISIILARLLMPSDYGVLALTSVFIFFTDILVQSGLSTSLIRKEDVDDIDYSTAFFFSFAVASVCYIVFWFISGYIADFYSQPIIKPVLRVQMLCLFIGAFSTVRAAKITREFRFKEMCNINVIATFIGGISGIAFAYNGYGVWSLVFYTLIRDSLVNLLLLNIVKWKLKFVFSLDRLKYLISFSIWVLFSTIIDFLGNNILYIILGKKYSMSDIGLYNKGGQLSELVCLHVFGSISAVLLPTLANIQNDKTALKTVCRKMVSMSCYVIFPMMTGLAMVASNLVPLLFTDKWVDCIPVLWMSCVCFGVNPVRSINMQLLYALGESKKAMYVEISRFLLLISGYILVIFIMKLNIYYIAINSAIVALCVVFITQLYTKRYIDYSYYELLKDIFPSTIYCFIMALAVYFVGILTFNKVFVLFLQILCGIIVYVTLSTIFKNKCYIEIIEIIKNRINKRIINE